MPAVVVQVPNPAMRQATWRAECADCRPNATHPFATIWLTTPLHHRADVVRAAALHNEKRHP